MTDGERNLMTPIEGLMIYNKTTKKPKSYDGTVWRNMDGSLSLSVGTPYHGGIVAYILAAGDPGYDANVPHGLIAAPSDQSGGIQWWNGSYVTIGITSQALGTGSSNTNTIIAGQGAGNCAAKICANLLLNGYTGWYLPSKDELAKLYLNSGIIGGFKSYAYDWSSSAYSGNSTAWYHDFYTGNPVTGYTDIVHSVRAIHSF